MRRSWIVLAVVAAILVVTASTIAAAKPPGGTGRQVVERTVTLTPPDGGDILNINEVVSCPSGAASVNGGWAWVNPPPNQSPERRVAGGPDGTNWRVVVSNLFVDPPGSTNTFTLWAICVNA
jgi:hypothetical protein